MGQLPALCCDGSQDAARNRRSQVIAPDCLPRFELRGLRRNGHVGKHDGMLEDARGGWVVLPEFLEDGIPQRKHAVARLHERTTLQGARLPWRAVATKADQVKSSKAPVQRRDSARALGILPEELAWVSVNERLGVKELRVEASALLGGA